MKEQIETILKAFMSLEPGEQVEVFNTVKEELINVRTRRADEHIQVSKQNHELAEFLRQGTDVIKNGHQALKPQISSEDIRKY